MHKSKKFYGVFFPVEVLRAAVSALKASDGSKFRYRRNVSLSTEDWDHDNDAEFFADYRKSPTAASFALDDDRAHGLVVHFYNRLTEVTVKGSSRSQIEEVMHIFDAAQDISRLPTDPKAQSKIKIFLGHGASPLWRDLRDHLRDKHDYTIEAYEVGARAGHTIRDILDGMLRRSSMAFLVLTGENPDSTGKMHARENVIHELGLFQGHLGFSRAIALVEEGTEEFSNIHGIQQLRFSKGKIAEIYGDVIATIKREFEIRPDNHSNR